MADRHCKRKLEPPLPLRMDGERGLHEGTRISTGICCMASGPRRVSSTGADLGMSIFVITP
eukprot:6311055-Prymnesium_polylepis.1